jgi:hypothetical protein
MKRIKGALVAVFWLMLASVLMILMWLTFVISAVYVSFAVLGALFFRTQALGPLAYICEGIGLALGAGAILLVVAFVNCKDDPRFVNSLAQNPESASGVSRQVAP